MEKYVITDLQPDLYVEHCFTDNKMQRIDICCMKILPVYEYYFYL